MKPVRIISPYPPGSSADVIGRIYAPRLTEALGKQFVVDNRAGASGNIAAEIVARATPDGYTMLFTVGSDLAMRQGATGGLNLLNDFTPIASSVASVEPAVGTTPGTPPGPTTSMEPWDPP